MLVYFVTQRRLYEAGAFVLSPFQPGIGVLRLESCGGSDVLKTSAVPANNNFCDTGFPPNPLFGERRLFRSLYFRRMNLLTMQLPSYRQPISSQLMSIRLSVHATPNVGGVNVQATPSVDRSSWSVAFIPGFDSSIVWTVTGKSVGCYRDFKIRMTQQIECTPGTN